jgi:hypothetical protein
MAGQVIALSEASRLFKVSEIARAEEHTGSSTAFAA